jgi:hypothetical protein
MEMDYDDGVKEALAKALPEGTDLEEVCKTLADAGVSLTMVSVEPTEDMPESSENEEEEDTEASPSGAPVDGEPEGEDMDEGEAVFTGVPTDDLIMKAFKAAQAEGKKKPMS